MRSKLFFECYATVIYCGFLFLNNCEKVTVLDSDHRVMPIIFLNVINITLLNSIVHTAKKRL